MKITVTQYDRTISVERENDDLSAFELLREFTNIMIALEYSQEIVEDAILGLAEGINLNNENINEKEDIIQ